MSSSTFSYLLPTPRMSYKVLHSILAEGPPHHRGSYLHPSLPYNIYEQDSFDLLCLQALRAPGFYSPRRPERQGLTFSRHRVRYMMVYTVENPVDGWDLRRIPPDDMAQQIGWTLDADGFFKLSPVQLRGMEIAEVSEQLWTDALLQLNRRTLLRFSLLNLPGDVRHSPEDVQQQGNSVTNIYGNGNSVTTDVGANGWTPTVNTSVGDNPITSSSADSDLPGVKGGSSTATKTTTRTTGTANEVGSRYRKWWEPAAARGLERGIDHMINLGDAAVGGAVSATKAGVDALKGKLAKSTSSSAPTDTPTPAVTTLFSTIPTANQAGNSEIQSQAPSSTVIAYPPTPSVVLPSPDFPSVPGPSGDRAWLIDTFPWEQGRVQSYWISGPNSYDLSNPTYPPKPKGSSLGGCYPLPWALVTAQPQCVWSAMYSNHSYWNSGFRVQLTVNGSQFHAGALVLSAAPEWHGSVYSSEADLFVAPYAILNLATGNTATLEVPFISPTPNASTDFLHAPWVFFVSILSPLAVPTGAPNTLQCSLYVTPINSSFHGLRYPVKQHIKVRNVPGNGAFGTAVAGQEMPLVGVAAERPDVSYLPAEVFNWLEFASRPGLITQLTWTMAEEPGERLQVLPISPDALASTTTGIGFVLSLFSQWKGEIVVRLLFTGSAQHYGRLIVAYTPPASRPPTDMSEAMHGTYSVWDVNGSSTLDFTIPFMSQSYWKTVDIGTPDGLLSNNGYFSIFVMNPLTGPSGSPPSANIEAFVMAGDTFRLRFQQSPALGWQANEQQVEVPLNPSSMDVDVPTGDLGHQTTMEYHDSDLYPDTYLQNYFSFFRYLSLQEGGGSLLMDAGAVHLYPLDPMTMFTSDVSKLLSCFTYFTADFRVNLRIVSNLSSSTTFSVALIPAGATIPPGVLDPSIATAALSNFTLIEQPLPATGTVEVSLSFPYTSPQSALCTTYNGWETYSGSGYGTLHSNTFGTLVFYSIAPNFAAPPPGAINSQVISISAWFSFGGFRAFVPRPPPTLGPIPKTSLVRKGPLTALTVPRRAQVFARRQAAESYLDIGCEPEDRAYVVRAQRPTYVHWAIQYERWDGNISQVSLSNAGTYAVISYEPPEGERVCEVELDCWERASVLVGEIYPYNAHSNCSTFISDLTGYPCSNTGLSIGAGVGILGLAALAAGVKTLVARRQGLSDLSTAARVITQRNVDDAFTVARDGIRAVDQGTARLATAADRLLEASDRVRLQHVETAAENIRAAAERMATSMDGARETVNKLVEVFHKGDQPSPFTRFFSWLAKFFGYLLIIFGSPTPMSIGGLLLIILADAATDVTSFFQETGNVVAAAFYWIASKLGYSVSPQEAVEAAGEPERQGVKDFNDGVTAVKNCEYLLDKVLALVERVMKWLDKKAGSDPMKQVSDSHPKILELYSDSVSAVNSPPTMVDLDNVRQNHATTTELLTVAQKAKSQNHVVLLSQTLRNYSTLLGRAPVHNPGSRPEPLVVYLYGPPGCGKSLVASLLAAVLAAKLGSGPDDYYSPTSPGCEFFDGYTGQPVHFIDDIGQDPEGRDWASFPNLVSTAPFIVPMASLESKGTYYTSKVIVATSNFQGPNDRSARSLAALDRRLHIRIKVTPQGSFSVDDALASCGPATKYFSNECPLVRLESNDLVFDSRSQYSCPLNTLDDLVDLILDHVTSRKGLNCVFKKLVRQSADGVPTSLVNHNYQGRIPNSVDDEFTQAVKKNTAVDLITKIWNFKTPLFLTATFLTIISSLVAIFYFARELRNERAQGAYSALPVQKKKAAPPPRPPPIRTNAAVRQSGETLSPAIPKIGENVVPISALDESGNALRHMSFLYVEGRWGVTASHLIEGATSINVNGTIHQLEDLDFAVDGELMVISVPGREHKNLRRFLSPSQSYPNGFLVSALFGSKSYVRFSQLRQASLNIENVIVDSSALLYSCSSFPGLCGSPVIVTDPSGVRIVGVHVAGIPGSSGMGCQLSLERWDSMLLSFAETQSILLPEDPVGPPTHIQRQTAIHPSPAHGAFPLKKEPAVLTRNDPRLGPDVSFDVQIFSKHDKGDITEPWPGLIEAFDLYFSSFPSEIRTLSMAEAINGTPLLDGIDMSQSPGYPWVSKGRSRRSLFSYENGEWVPLPELVVEVEKVLKDPVYVYTTSLKDELRPIEKVKCGGTRLIEAAPIQAIIAGRMLLGGLFEYMQTHPGKHGSAVGCDPDYHWTKFFWDFSPYSQVFDLDYKGFDATLPTVCFTLLSEHLENLIGDPRITPYVSSISNSLHVFGSKFYRMVGGNPSGCVGTSIINTIINNCCLLSALMSHPDFSPRSYLILAYGDDVIYAHDPPIHPSFVKQFYDEHTTLVVTPASKQGDFPETSEIYDVTFLKRWFVPDDLRPVYIHPVINPDVYEQSVMWVRSGDFQDVITSLCYLAFHSGPNNYLKWCGAVSWRCRANGVNPEFLPYSFLQMQWLKLVSA
uniref:Genome polyprotein n=1 Tax=Bat picornavirus TaxID=1281456 RepID=A0A6C0WWK7_9PICO|nr:polyprotein [Bat picornavirus]